MRHQIASNLYVLAMHLFEASADAEASDRARVCFDRAAHAFMWLAGVRYSAEDRALFK